MLPNELTKDVRTRLLTIKGQLDGMIRMLEKDGDPEKILHQFKAIQKGLDKSHFLLMDEVYRKALAIKIVETIDSCPGNCGNEERIEFIRKQFPNLEFDDLTDHMKEISILKDRLDHLSQE